MNPRMKVATGDRIGASDANRLQINRITLSATSNYQPMVQARVIGNPRMCCKRLQKIAEHLCYM
ncbi:protein of unknown function [Rhodovastum atsumiense]|nr:protein of unknown function [Rhodovastum atsumiense]